GVGGRAERGVAAADAQCDPRLTDRAGGRALRAPAAGGVEREFQRTIFAVRRGARLRVVTAREQAQRTGAGEGARTEQRPAREPAAQERDVLALVAEPGAGAAAERRARAAVRGGERPGRAGAAKDRAAPPARRQPARGHGAGRERRLDAAAGQRVVTVAHRGARAAAAEAHALRAPELRAATARGAHGDLELLV